MQKRKLTLIAQSLVSALSALTIVSCGNNTAPSKPDNAPAANSSTSASKPSFKSDPSIDNEESAEMINDVSRINDEREQSELPEVHKQLMKHKKIISNDTPKDRDRNARVEYKRIVIRELTKHWHLMKGTEAPYISMRIGRDGTVLSTKVVESSGDSEVDDEAIKAINNLKLPPLDDDIKAKKLGLRVDFNRITAKQQREADKVLTGTKTRKLR